jgi:hypothetical protein
MIVSIRRSSILLCALVFLLECGPAVAQQSPWLKVRNLYKMRHFGD